MGHVSAITFPSDECNLLGALIKHAVNVLNENIAIYCTCMKHISLASVLIFRLIPSI